MRHALQTMSEGEFRRSWLNQQTRSDERIISAEMWDLVQAPGVAPEGDLRFGFDVAPDRSSDAVAVSDSAGQVEVVEHRAGVDWLVDRVVELSSRWQAPVVLDGYSPAGGFGDVLEGRGVQVVRYSTREVAFACGGFFDAVVARSIAVRPHDGLSLAVESVRRRQVGDSCWC